MPSIEGGGVEKNLFIIVNFLSKKFKKICLITASKEFKKKFKGIDLICPNLDLSSYNRKVKYIFCLYELLKLIIKNRDIVVFSFQANIYCILLTKLFNIKIVVRSNSSPSGWSKNFIKKKIFKFVLGLADTIIVNSNDFKKEFKTKFNLNSVKIYNPLNKNEIIKLANKKVNFPFFDKSKKTLKLINIGRLTDQKDHITLLRSVKELKKKINFKLLIIGRGINLDEINNYIKFNKLQNNVKILNFKNNPFPYLKKAHLFILTSRFEGLPNVLLEAATLKKFIISTRCPTGPNEILKNGKLGFLCKVGNYKEIAKKILYFKLNKNLSNKMIKKNFNSLYRFDSNENLKKYLLELKKLLENK